MRDLFKKTFEKEMMPEISKRRVGNKLMEAYNGEREMHRAPVKKRISAVACIVAISGITVMAGTTLGESIADKIRNMFVSREEALTEAYNGEKIDKYVHTAEAEYSDFDDSEVQLQFVSYMGDANGIQILLQYAVDNDIPGAFPNIENAYIEGKHEAYISDERWINRENNRGYLIIYADVPQDGNYRLTLEDMRWGSRYFEGKYTVEFCVDGSNAARIYQVDREYILYAEEEKQEKVRVKNVGLSPVTCTITVRLHENFNVNRTFAGVLGAHGDEMKNALYFIDRNGKKCDIICKAAFCSMWETNGRLDEDGCELAGEGAETTLLVWFDSAADTEQVAGVHLLGADIMFKQ